LFFSMNRASYPLTLETGQHPSDLGTKPMGEIRKVEIDKFIKGSNILPNSTSFNNLAQVSSSAILQ
jgi:hypothetical protein